MEIARNQRGSREAGGRPQGHQDRARGRARRRARQKNYTVEEEEDEEEQHHRQQRGDGPNPSVPNLAVHFANLTNAILRGIKDEGTNDKLYDEFMQNAKEKLIFDLKEAYNELYNFYNDPSRRMPDWLSESPPAKSFSTRKLDQRLLSKESQIEQELRAFVEGLGFVCLNVIHYNCFTGFSLTLRLDVATVPTTEAREHAKSRLLTLEEFRNDQKSSSGPSRRS